MDNLYQRAINIFNDHLKDDILQVGITPEDVGKVIGIVGYIDGKPVFGPVQDTNKDGRLPDPVAGDAGKVLGITNGEGGPVYSPITVSVEDSRIPDPAASDIGKVLGITNGEDGPVYTPIEAGDSGLPDPSDLNNGTGIVVVGNEWKTEKGYPYHIDRVILPEQTATAEYDESEECAFAEIDITEALNPLSIYYVIFNGIEYECVPRYLPDDMVKLSFGNDNTIIYENNKITIIITADTSVEFTLKIEERIYKNNGTLVIDGKWDVSEDYYRVTSINAEYLEVVEAILKNKKVILRTTRDGDPLEDCDRVFMFNLVSYDPLIRRLYFSCIDRFDESSQNINILRIEVDDSMEPENVFKVITTTDIT